MANQNGEGDRSQLTSHFLLLSSFHPIVKRIKAAASSA
jgi:hypothetical protein